MKPPNTLTGGAGRVEFVDVLRGFALLGVFGANLLIFSGYTYMSDAQRAALPTAGADGVVPGSLVFGSESWEEAVRWVQSQDAPGATR